MFTIMCIKMDKKVFQMSKKYRFYIYILLKMALYHMFSEIHVFTATVWKNLVSFIIRTLA